MKSLNIHVVKPGGSVCIGITFVTCFKIYLAHVNLKTLPEYIYIVYIINVKIINLLTFMPALTVYQVQ